MEQGVSDFTGKSLKESDLPIEGNFFIFKFVNLSSSYEVMVIHNQTIYPKMFTSKVLKKKLKVLTSAGTGILKLNILVPQPNKWPYFIVYLRNSSLDQNGCTHFLTETGRAPKSTTIRSSPFAF